MNKQKTKFKKTEIGMIPEEWDIKRVSKLYDISSGLSKPRKEFGFGYPFLTFKEIFDNYTIPKKLNSLVNSTEKERKTCSIKRGDVFLTRTSETIEDLGMSSVALNDYENATFNGFAKRLRPRNESILPEFSAYLFRDIRTRKQIDKFSSLTTRASLNSSMIKEILLSIPSHKEQKAIAKVLSDLDDKIELLKNQNKTLEAIAQAIFKRWFVDFEFPNDKEKPYKSSGGKMVYNEEFKKEIPEGWKIGKLKDLGNIQPGFAFKSKDFINDGIGLIKIRNIQNCVIDLEFESFLSKNIFEKIDRNFHLMSGDVLIAMTGAKIGKIGIIPKSKKIHLLNQRVGNVISKNKYLFYLFLKTPEIQGLIKGGSSSSSAQENISSTDIENFNIILANDKIIKDISSILECLFNKIIDNLGQNIEFSQIRDSLLPKLMSGKIRVPR